ncbi:hypothetical protein CULT_2090004 [[Clostridium] ultunense Esp]|nr:hypothetical protein CULT_2090004 [[Clostridium] ultunense Esp]
MLHSMGIYLYFPFIDLPLYEQYVLHINILMFIYLIHLIT